MKYPKFNYMKWAKRIDQTEGLHLSTSSVPQLTAQQIQLDQNSPGLIQSSGYGNPKLIDWIAKRYDTKTDSIFICPGSSTANFVISAVLLNSGDEAIVESPAYEVLAQLPEVFGSKVKRLNRTFENAWRIDFAELENLISSKTKMIFLTNPHNPSGKAFTNADYHELSQIAAQNSIFIIIDEVYIDMDSKNPRISQEDVNDKIIFTNSLTKSFGLGGIRVGWVIASPEIIQECKDFNDLISVVNAEPSMDIALQAISKLDVNMQRFQNLIAENTKIVESWLKGIPEFTWVKPDGIAFCFVKVSDKINVDKLCQILADEYQTFVVPGKFFDNNVEFFRLGFSLPSDKLKTGLSNISQALKEL